MSTTANPTASKTASTTAAEVRLKKLRRQIDQADRELLKNLRARFQAVQKIGALKRRHHIQVVQDDRWEQVVQDRLKRAGRLKLPSRLIENIFELIHQEAIRIQKRNTS